MITAPIQVSLYSAIRVYEFVDDNPDACAENRAFQPVVKHADRIVVRDGGFGCCCDVDKAAIYCIVTNSAEIASFNRMFRFSGKGEGCKCCGDFGVDWWQGTNRIALTAVHHGETLQWNGFDGDYAQLRAMASYEILSWYNGHCREMALLQ